MTVSRSASAGRDWWRPRPVLLLPKHDSGTSLEALAQSFVDSREFQSQYPNLSDGAFVSLLYQRALGRPAEQAGATGYIAELDRGVSRGTVAVQIAESLESQRHNLGRIETGFHLA